MLKFYKVHAEDDCDFFDVIGASRPEDAAKEFVQKIKKDQLEEIEYGKKQYAELKEAGEITDSYENSGYTINVVLPKVVMVTPMHDPSGYHEQSISDDRKYMAQAFDALWDYDNCVEVRL